MKSYVINLDRASERRSHIDEQFARLGLNYFRVPAIDGKTLSPSEYEELSAKYRPQINRGWSRSYMSCFLSHFAAWQRIADDDDDYAAIFEDDVHLSPNFKVVAESDFAVPGEIDIVRLETTMQSLRIEREALASWGPMHMHELKDGAWGSAGYILKRDVACWLVQTPARYHYSTDWMLFQKSWPAGRAMRIAQLDPAPCIQDQYHPDAAAKRNFEKITLDRADLYSRLRSTARWLVAPPLRYLVGKRVVLFS